MFRRLLHMWFGVPLTGTCGSRKQRARRRPQFFRPLLQQLEDRLAPAAVTAVSTSGLGITAGTGDLRAGQVVQLTVNFSAAVTVNTSNGFATLALNDGGTAGYSGASSTTALTFLYTVTAGQNTSDLTVTAFDLNGAVIKDSGTGNNADLSGAVTNPAGTLRIDTIAPTLVSMTRVGSANQNDGSVVPYAVTFSEPVVGVTTSSFSLTTTGVAGASISGVTPGVDAAHYTVNVASGSVASGTGVGTVGLNLVGANITDLAGNGLGGGSFSAAPGSPFAIDDNGAVVAVALADLTGNGIQDIVTANSDGQVSVLLGNGSGSFNPAPGSPYALGASPLAMAIADVNGDGIPDIVTANGVGGTITQYSVLLGNGNGSFTAVHGSPFVLGENPQSVAIADVNGDGKPDVVTANSGIPNVFGENVSVLAGNGNGTFSNASGSPYPVGNNPISVTVADLTNNGIQDIVVANKDDNTVSVLLGNGGGSFSPDPFSSPGLPPGTFAVGTSPVSVAVADLTNNGIPDIVTANSGSNDVSVLMGNGNGSFQTATSVPVDQGPVSVAIADLNGDGIPDIVTANAVSDDVSVLLGNGHGSFSNAPGSPFQTFTSVNGSEQFTTPVSVAIADLNGDGRPDIAIATSYQTYPSRAYINGVIVLSNNVVPQAGPSFTLHDTTPPTVGTVNDGTGADISFQPYTTTIAANWTGFSDAGSGIASYQWAIGTTPGGTNVQAFTSVGTRTSARNSLLNLTEGDTYYVSVRAIDGVGNISTAANSNGVTILPQSSFLKGNVGTFTDSDGDKYTVQLTPSNVGQVAVEQDLTAPGKGPIQLIVLQNTNPTKSVLTITVVRKGTGDGLVSVDDIDCLGAADQPLGYGVLKSIVAPNCDLVGGILLGGTARQATSITVHNIDAGATITGGSQLSITAQNIGAGAIITDDNKVAALTAASFGAGSIVAPSLGTLKILGNFDGDVTLSGQGVPANQLTLTQANIGGTVTGALLNIAGNVGSFKTEEFVNSELFVGFTPTDSQNPLNGGTFVDGLNIASFQVTGLSAAFSNSVVAASQVGSVSLQSVQTSNGGKKFGILAEGNPTSVQVVSPAFTFNPAQPTPQGIGDFEVLDDTRE